MSKKRYRLYALPTSEANIVRCVNERFIRITLDYILVYKRGRAISSDAVEIMEMDLPRLTAADEQWLFDCNVVLLGEEVRDKAPEILTSISKKIDALEGALKAAKESEVASVG